MRVVVVGGLRAVGFRVAPVLAAVVHEAAPDHHAAERFERAGKQVGAFGVVAPVGIRAGAELAVRLHQKAAEIGYVAVDELHALPPPSLHARVQRVGGSQAVAHRHGVIDRQNQPDAERGEEPRHAGNFGQKTLADQLLRGLGDVDVVQTDGVDPNGREQPRIRTQAVVAAAEIIVCKEKGAARVAALHMAVHVVPVVEHAQGKRGRLHALRQRAARALPLQQPVRAVEHACFTAGDRAAASADFIAVAHRPDPPSAAQATPACSSSQRAASGGVCRVSGTPFRRSASIDPSSSLHLVLNCQPIFNYRLTI